MRRLFILFLFIPLYSQAQYGLWDTLNYPYVGSVQFIESFESEGMFLTSGFIFLNDTSSNVPLLKYQNDSWQELGLFNNKVWSATMYHDTIIAGGRFSIIDGQSASELAWYDGQDWHPLGDFRNSMSDSMAMIRNIRVIDDVLYVMGGFELVDGDSIANIAKWQDGKWKPFYNFNGTNMVADIAFYKGKWYAAGNFCVNSQFCDIAMYDSGEWQQVGIGLSGGFTHVEKMLVYKDYLYIVGWIQKPDGNVGHGIQRWDGTIWSEVGDGFDNPFGVVHTWDMQVYEDKLYVVGGFFQAGNIKAHYVSSWDGNKWCAMNTNVFDTTITQLNAIGILNDTLYMAGLYGFPQPDTTAPLLYMGVSKTSINYPSDTCSIDYLTSVRGPLANKIEWSIYPNPVTDELHISFAAARLKRVVVTDISGKVVFDKHLIDKEVSVDFSDFKPGTYIIQTIEEDRTGHLKFVKL